MKFQLYIDECGDHSLSNIDENFPVFTLCGVVFYQKSYTELETELSKLKHHFWGNKNIILHSRDIRKCQKGFEILFDLKIKEEFYNMLNQIMKNIHYKVIASNILKEPYIKKYGKMNDVYGISLSFIIERTIFLLDSAKKKTGKQPEIDIIVEKRGKNEDKELLKYYNELLDKGTYYIKPERLKEYIKSFEFKGKKEIVAGLEISDLVAYPIAKYILNPKEVNFAYEIIKEKIYSKDGKLYGLKKFP